MKNWMIAAAATAMLLPASGLSAQQTSDPIAPLPETSTSDEAEASVRPPVWQPGDVEALLRVIDSVGEEGLAPSDYDPAGLRRARASGDQTMMSAAATERYLLLAQDLAFGHVRGKDRQDWYLEDDKFSDAQQDYHLRKALYEHNVIGSLRGLLPTHPQYASLKNALAKADPADTDKINRIRLNMDRWRWLPRELGDKYIIVNVPSFHATLVENGEVRWKRRAIAGAIKTKTPQLNAIATGVVLNPWWEVPSSIAREVAGKNGYVALRDDNGKVIRWRQPPGPRNALGKLKFVMYNEHAIYLHDTNARSRFNDQVRALSHGCVRTENVVDLAKELLSDDNGEWTREKVDEVLNSGKTVTAKFVKPVPVYIVYFSSAALNDGTIHDYQDLYKRDAKVIAALLDNPRAPKAVEGRATAASDAAM